MVFFSCFTTLSYLAVVVINRDFLHASVVDRVIIVIHFKFNYTIYIFLRVVSYLVHSKHREGFFNLLRGSAMRRNLNPCRSTHSIKEKFGG